jgi:hypothetical protein
VTREICFDGLDNIVTSATTAHAVFNLPDDDNDAVLQRSGGSLTLTPALPPWARAPFTPTKFVNPTATMAIHGGGGDDIVEVIGTQSITLAPYVVMDVEVLEIEMISNAVVTVGAMLVKGDLQLNSLGKINGNAIQVEGDVVSNVPTLQGTATISLVGDADQTLSGPGQVPHLDFSKSGGTITVATDFGVRGHLTGAGGIFAPSAGYLVLQEWNSTINVGSGVQLYNLEIYKIHTEQASLLSDLVVQGNLRVLQGGLNLGVFHVFVGGDMFVATDSRLTFTIDVANPPATPRLQVVGTLTFADHAILKVVTSGSSGPSVGGNHELVRAGAIVGFDDVWLELGAIDNVFEDFASLFLDFEEP